MAKRKATKSEIPDADVDVATTKFRTALTQHQIQNTTPNQFTYTHTTDETVAMTYGNLSEQLGKPIKEVAAEHNIAAFNPGQNNADEMMKRGIDSVKNNKKPFSIIYGDEKSNHTVTIMLLPDKKAKDGISVVYFNPQTNESNPQSEIGRDFAQKLATRAGQDDIVDVSFSNQVAHNYSGKTNSLIIPAILNNPEIILDQAIPLKDKHHFLKYEAGIPDISNGNAMQAFMKEQDEKYFKSMKEFEENNGELIAKTPSRPQMTELAQNNITEIFKRHSDGSTSHEMEKVDKKLLDNYIKKYGKDTIQTVSNKYKEKVNEQQPPIGKSPDKGPPQGQKKPTHYQQVVGDRTIVNNIWTNGTQPTVRQHHSPTSPVVTNYYSDTTTQNPYHEQYQNSGPPRPTLRPTGKWDEKVVNNILNAQYMKQNSDNFAPNQKDWANSVLNDAYADSPYRVQQLADKLGELQKSGKFKPPIGIQENNDIIKNFNGLIHPTPQGTDKSNDAKARANLLNFEHKFGKERVDNLIMEYHNQPKDPALKFQLPNKNVKEQIEKTYEEIIKPGYTDEARNNSITKLNEHRKEYGKELVEAVILSHAIRNDLYHTANQSGKGINPVKLPIDDKIKDNIGTTYKNSIDKTSTPETKSSAKLQLERFEKLHGKTEVGSTITKYAQENKLPPPAKAPSTSKEGALFLRRY